MEICECASCQMERAIARARMQGMEHPQIVLMFVDHLNEAFQGEHLVEVQDRREIENTGVVH